VLRLLTTVRPSVRLTTTGRGRSPLDWPRRQPRPDFDEYVDSIDVEFRSAVYDDDDNDVPNASYDVGKSLTVSQDVVTTRPDVTQTSTTSTEHIETKHSPWGGEDRSRVSTIALFRPNAASWNCQWAASDCDSQAALAR